MSAVQLRETLHASLRSLNKKSLTAEGWEWRSTVLSRDLQCVGKRAASNLERVMIKHCTEDILAGRILPRDLQLAALVATPGSVCNQSAVVMGVLEGIYRVWLLASNHVGICSEMCSSMFSISRLWVRKTAT